MPAWKSQISAAGVVIASEISIHLGVVCGKRSPRKKLDFSVQVTEVAGIEFRAQI